MTGVWRHVVYALVTNTGHWKENAKNRERYEFYQKNFEQFKTNLSILKEYVQPERINGWEKKQELFFLQKLNCPWFQKYFDVSLWCVKTISHFAEVGVDPASIRIFHLSFGQSSHGTSGLVIVETHDHL